MGFRRDRETKSAYIETWSIMKQKKKNHDERTYSVQNPEKSRKTTAYQLRDVADRKESFMEAKMDTDKWCFVCRICRFVTQSPCVLSSITIPHAQFTHVLL